MFALITTEEMDKLGQVLVKQLKNRYNDTANNKRFVVGINRAKMKLFDVEESAQADIVNTTPSPQKQQFKAFGGGGEKKFGKRENDSKFKGWKV